MPSITDRRRDYHRLHENGTFVIPNPWDIGTARYLQHQGFKAIATTSAGYAFAVGRPDNAVPRDMMLAHIAELVAATDIPVNADYENGYAHNPADVAENTRLCVETGVAGLSIEDSTGDVSKPLYDLDTAVARVKAARAAIDKTGGDTLFTARAECFLVGVTDLDETIRRLKAYAAAGADCLYAPGLRTREQFEAVVKAVAPKPINALIGFPSEMKVSDFAAIGVRRISVGGALARAAWGGVVRTAKLLQEGSFAGFADAAPHADLNNFFRDDLKRRSS